MQYEELNEVVALATITGTVKDDGSWTVSITATVEEIWRAICEIFS